MSAVARLKTPLPRARRLRLLVREVGSEPLTSGGSECFDETVVIAQLPGESSSSFVGRALERITRARAQGGIAELAVEAAGRTSLGTREALLALVEQLLGDNISVRLRFGEPDDLAAEQDSGVFWRTPAAS
jgi:hypothetical protein